MDHVNDLRWHVSEVDHEFIILMMDGSAARITSSIADLGGGLAFRTDDHGYTVLPWHRILQVRYREAEEMR